MAAGRVSIIDVAARAGVSKSTASRALLGQSDVADKVRARVEQAATELGYVKDYRAHLLKSTDTTTIAVFVRAVQLSFYGELVAAIQGHVERAGYQLTVAAASSDARTEPAAIDRMMGLRPAGVIFASGRVPADVIAGAARSAPVVLAGRGARIPTVGSVCDDASGTRVLAEMILERGHRRVGVLIPSKSWSTTLQDRATRMRKALNDLGIDTTVIPFAAESDHADSETLARAVESVTAIMCPNDPTVISTWEQLDELGYDVPTDVSLTGYDGIGQLASPVLGLTTWRQPIAEIGRAASEQLLARIADPSVKARHLRLAGTLLDGRTLAGPRKR